MKTLPENGGSLGAQVNLNLLISDQKLLEQIRAVLSNQTSIDALKPKLHVPVLLLHQCEITKSMNGPDSKQLEALKKYHIERAEAFFQRQNKKLSEIHLYDQITFHLVIFPVPEKTTIIDKFVETAKFYKAS